MTITNLTLANGLGQGGAGGYGGGAAGMGGAVFQNGGNLTLTNVSFSENQAVGGSTPGFDGGGGFGGDSTSETGQAAETWAAPAEFFKVVTEAKAQAAHPH